MVASLTLALLLQPAQFVVKVDTNTSVSVFVGDTQITPGQVYQVAISGSVSIPITVKFVDGDQVVTKSGLMILHPGKTRIITIKVFARPPTIVQV